MDSYKEYLQLFRKKELENPRLFLSDENISIKLNKFIHRVENVKLNSESYYLYYGEIKNIVTSFLCYWTEYIDVCVRNADKYSNFDLNKDLMEVLDKTMMMQQEKQVLFGNEFLPIKSDIEKRTYEEVETQFCKYMENLQDLSLVAVKIVKKHLLEEFLKEQVQMSLAYYRDLLDLTHSFIGLMLADRVKEIRISLEEIQHRIRKSLKEVQSDLSVEYGALVNQLYEMNKVKMFLQRKSTRPSMQISEKGHAIQELSKQMGCQNIHENVVEKIKTELEYWRRRIEYLNTISNTLEKLKAERELLTKQQETYNLLKTTELPGSKYDAWKNMGINYNQHKEYLKENTIQAAKTLITFFFVKGDNRLMTQDANPYVIDEMGHRVYVLDSGIRRYHETHEGFKEIRDTDEYYFDKRGRYVLDKDGTKLYKSAYCAAAYRLDEQKDYVNVKEEDFQADKKYLYDEEMFPFKDPVDIRSTLDKEVTTYLWACFGSILPEVLRDVGTVKPANPTFYMAHRLLHYKYNKETKQTEFMKKEATAHRENVFKARHEKAVKEALYYKSKVVQRCKPEHIDDTNEREAYETYVAAKDFVNSLNFFY